MGIKFHSFIRMVVLVSDGSGTTRTPVRNKQTPKLTCLLRPEHLREASDEHELCTNPTTQVRPFSLAHIFIQALSYEREEFHSFTMFTIEKFGPSMISHLFWKCLISTESTPPFHGKDHYNARCIKSHTLQFK